MNRLILACALAIAAGGMVSGAAMAQVAATGTTTTGTTTTGTTTTGIAKPPPGTSPPSAPPVDHSSNTSVLGNNTPTTPQIALHPEATIGSPVPIAGPGGTTRSPTGD